MEQKKQYLLFDQMSQNQSTTIQSQKKIGKRLKNLTSFQDYQGKIFEQQQTSCRQINSQKKLITENHHKKQNSQKSTLYFSKGQHEDQEDTQSVSDFVINSKQKKNDISITKTIEQKLKYHLRTLQKSDKYIRMVCAFLKTYRAYHKETRFNNLYKELLLTRRVIRLQSKYVTARDFCMKTQSKGMKLFKILQMMADIFDWLSLWMLICNKGTQNSSKNIKRLEQWESNCYFLQCCIWLIIYVWRLIGLKLNNKGEMTQQERKSKVTQNSLKSVKYLLDMLTSYNNSSLINVFGNYSPKTSGYLTILSSIIGMVLLWR